MEQSSPTSDPAAEAEERIRLRTRETRPVAMVDVVDRTATPSIWTQPGPRSQARALAPSG